ncbi:FAD-dependent oxidoreductase [Niallia oryzisoli]|uniref:FAD-dependent oxidoreductase n=1 Tax=Niallia oryzisoli TaxID=1737571 RepID=A0ABZ2CDE8_9BACI
MIKGWIGIDGHVFDVVIIGGGLTGLTAAVFLAQGGKRVAVLEKGKGFGGRAVTKEMAGSYFNLGPHAFYKKGVAARVLRELGIKLEGGSPSTKGAIYVEEQKFQLPGTMMDLFRTKLLTWKEKREFVSLLMNIQRMNPQNFYNQTIQQWVETRLKSKRNQELFYAFCRLASYINAPTIANAGVILRQLKTSLNGAVYVDGGWQTIIDQLKEKAEKLGVVLLNNCKVEQVDMHEEVKVISLTKVGGQKKIGAGWVLFTAAPKEILRLVKDIQHTHLGNMLSNSIPVKAACLDVALSRLTEPQQHFALDFENSLYYSNHSQAAKLAVNPKHQVVHVMKYLTPGGNPQPDQVKTQLAAFLEKNQPGWEVNLVAQRYIPHLIVTGRRG